MSLRKFMHPRNKYKTPPNFKTLAVMYPEFQRHTAIDLAGKLRFNFKNEESLRVLTKTLLKHDFNLDVQIPIEKLVPALPLRLNYIMWIEDLMKHAEINDINGIDIGTGAICIYSLLCAKINGWKMTATEIDPSSVISAVKNIENNSLNQLINVTSVEGEFILKGVIREMDSYSFTICNPPFFNLDKTDEIEKISPPRNAKTGNKIELTFDGGEYSFVQQIINESIELGDKIKIYTSMLGFKNTLLQCQNELKRRNIVNTTWTEFCQGHTKRWGLAWTFLPKHKLDLTVAPVIRTKRHNLNKIKSKNNITELVIPLTKQLSTINQTIDQLKIWIQELKIDMKELTLNNDEFDGWTCELCAVEDTWSHARRKRRTAMQNEHMKCKKMRIDVDDNETTEQTNNTTSSSSSASAQSHISNNKKPHLIFNLAVGKLNNNVKQIKSTQVDELKICMIYQSGDGGKNALETFKQYLINKLNIRKDKQQCGVKNPIESTE